MKNIKYATVILVMTMIITGCGKPTAEKVKSETGEKAPVNEEVCGTCAKPAPGITKAEYGKLEDGTVVDIYTLVNNKGAMAKIINYGGIVTELQMPDRDGKFGDVVLGFDNLKDYVEKSPYFGCLVGRYGNRIAGGKFKIDDTEYTLATNNSPDDKPCSLHGGLKGFDKQMWNATAMPENSTGPALVLQRVSSDMEEGYPGNMKVTAIYILTHNNELQLTYNATADKPTVVNLTHHSYFNLNGCTDTILDHEMMIAADKYTPVDSGLIPTGELAPVAGTPFDFNIPTKIGARVNDDNEQLKFGAGYDHNWVMKTQDGNVNLQCRIYDKKTGRVMEVLSDQPGLQFYCGNFLDGTLTGKKGIVYKHRYGMCLEPQHYPDSPNQPAFPSTLLKPGERYTNTIVYRFMTKPMTKK